MVIAILTLSVVVAILTEIVMELRKAVRYLMMQRNEDIWEARGFRPPGV